MFTELLSMYKLQILHKLSKSPIMSRILHGAFWTFLGTALAKALVLIASIICARILGKEKFGEFGMIRSTVNTFVVLGSVGLGVTATKYIAEYKNKNQDKVLSIYYLTNSFALLMGVMVTLIVVIAAPFIAGKYLQSDYLIFDLRIGGLLLFFTILNSAQNGALYGLENFKQVSFNTFWGSLTESILMLLGAYLLGVTGAILGFGMGFVVIFVLNKISLNKALGFFSIKNVLKNIKKEDVSILYKFSVPATLSSLMVAPTFWIVRSFLVRHDGYGELAIYEASEQWRTILLFVPSALSQIVLPILSSIQKEDSNSFWKVLWINMSMCSGFCLILVLIILVLKTKIMLLFGRDFTEATPLLVLCSSTIFSSASSVVGLAISSKSKMWVGFLFNLIWAIILIISAYYFLNLGMGAVSLCWAVLLSYVVLTVVQLFYLYKCYQHSSGKQ